MTSLDSLLKWVRHILGILIQAADTPADKPNASKAVESAILALGRAARVARDEVLHRILLSLVQHLNAPEPLRSLVYLQITELALHNNVTTYQLLSPAMGAISAHVVQRMFTAPTLLEELLALLNQQLGKFIHATLPHTLPLAIQKGNDRLLAGLAAAIKQSEREMCFEHAGAALKHFLLLPAPARDEAIQRFVIIIRGATDKATLENSTRLLLKSFKPQLLGHLVIHLGDEACRQAAIEGLSYLERSRSKSESTSASARDASAALSTFLRDDILEILAWLNDELAGAHGKTTLAQKIRTARSIGALVDAVGQSIASVTPQIMATLNSSMQLDELVLPTLLSWQAFITKMRFEDVAPFVGQTGASLVAAWPRFGAAEKEVAGSLLRYIVIDSGAEFASYLESDFPNLDTLEEELPDLSSAVRQRQRSAPGLRIGRVLERAASENASVSSQGLQELKRFLTRETDYVRTITSGNMFDPVVGRLVDVLFSAASKATEGQADVQDVCFESLGILGAVDPDRFELPSHEDTYIVLRNFEDRDESIDFCVHLIQRTLVGAFRASEDTRHQAALAYAIQELLKFCGFTPALLATSSSKPVALRVRQRWNEMSSETLEAVGPLLSSKYTAQMGEPTRRERPVYLNSSSFRDWIQTLANELILDAQGIEASSIFTILRSVIKDHDLSIARHILPHLVLHTLISGTEEQRQYIHAEICSILEDQVTPRTEMDSERRLLSAQVIFGLLDHISLWTRRRNETRKYAKPREAVPDNAVNHVSTVIGCISVELMARAALQCKAYARSLLNFERRVRDLKASGTKELDLQNYYEDMHFIYSNLEEPDGMEGISTSVLAPSLEHQIREHESLGRWTSAQSCWEVKLQAHPSEPDLHVGLLRCLRNLGHYDTMRTHIRGVLSAHPEWRSMLASYEVEGACILADWDAVRSALALETHQSDAHAMARIALAMHDQDPEAMHQAMREARRLVGRPIIAAGVGSYARAYDSVSQLHMIHELFLIQQQDEKNVLSTATATQRGQREQNQHAFSAHMLQRLNATLPSFRTREPLLSLRRSAFATRAIVDPVSSALIGQAWIQTAKNARHAGHDQTAYSAVLQATQRNVPLAFVQRAKLLALDDKKQTAVQELTSALAAVSDLSANATRTRSRSQQEDSVLGDPTDPSGPDRKSLARAHLLRARLIEETGRYSPNEVIESYKRIAEVESAYEKMWYCLGRYYDTNRDNLVNDLWCDYYVCRYYMKSAQSGTKYFYRTVPRMMTIWLDVGDDPVLIKAAGKQFTKSTDPEIYHKTDTFEKISSELRKASSRLQRYQILAVLPQLLSRVVHKHPSVWGTLSEIILAAVDVFPHQSLWAMMAGFQSKDPERKKRFMDLVKKLKSGVGARAKRISAIVEASQKMGKELLFLADAPVKSKETQLNLPLQFPKLQALADSGLILPLQSSVVVSLPGNGQIPTDYDPFGSPNGLPRLSGFDATIDIMPSLQKPRKVIMLGSDGKRYPFLCKPKDDLRKDARLMEFDSMINKLLQADSQARRRRLHIRTYSVITLNEECGLIEWVPNTIGLRHILQKNYARRDIPLYTHDLKVLLDEARNKPRKAADIFEKQVLSRYPSVFHEWFIATFPEPSAWLKARSAYAHTLAVMSMVGYVLGLGDRHGENILFDASNGDTVHVDLNCLFEKGLSFEIKEVVPFRLTHNMVDALGVTGVEGVFRRAAEISMRILRDNRDSLMSVLEAMIHDPLVEWAVDSAPKSKAGQDPRLAAARKALSPVQSKLDGLLRSHDRWTGPHSVNNAVDTLIRDATSSQLLASMYVGWASYL
ncbi:hypothetical protein IE81DRAFT_40965 [Ceraceosorus guamensis]|uniref:non-specific serine/threonine protein kinase n=1 Tax=Ceraceosorus guamensis TaxID=1522189 RepID=A0A316VS66_9BASI|nr:hypothetical protein IE81DRAFT_40965 [Ceraceosorus guamensis]PWN39253.1 hypothetical protein IE81DRAFT_40965 [Ceraceosorus guamensis]